MGEVELRAGAAGDWMAADTLGEADVLVLDHRGNRYHEDMDAAEVRGLLNCRGGRGARAFADNVLLPGAPLFLAHIAGRYNVAIHEVCEFLRPELDDWVIVCVPSNRHMWPADSVTGQRSSTMMQPTPELRRLAAEIDATSWRSEHVEVDWQAFQRQISPTLRGLAASYGLGNRSGSGSSSASGRSSGCISSSSNS